jgi:hypothetical protein
MRTQRVGRQLKSVKHCAQKLQLHALSIVPAIAAAVIAAAAKKAMLICD